MAAVGGGEGSGDGENGQGGGSVAILRPSCVLSLGLLMVARWPDSVKYESLETK